MHKYLTSLGLVIGCFVKIEFTFGWDWVASKAAARSAARASNSRFAVWEDWVTLVSVVVSNG